MQWQKVWWCRAQVVQSMVGQGSVFRLLLPVTTQHDAVRFASLQPLPVTRGRVLIVDDEAAIRSTIRRILERDHEVVTLGDPRDALSVLRNGDSFDVIFCDLMMPHLRGDVLHAKVKDEFPQIAERFVFVSGGATLPDPVSFLSEVLNERVDKPFNLQNLRGIARRFANARAVQR